MSKVEKKTGTFNVSVTYLGKTEIEQTATVVLEINYSNRNYSIVPFNNKDFKFQKSSENYKLWKAIIIAIDNAIDFANKELAL